MPGCTTVRNGMTWMICLVLFGAIIVREFPPGNSGRKLKKYFYVICGEIIAAVRLRNYR
jgi:hypothetical protein